MANTHGFNVPCIWIPQAGREGAAGVASEPDENRLGDLCSDISKTVVAKVQGNSECTHTQNRKLEPPKTRPPEIAVTQCAADCARLLTHIEKELRAESAKRAVKARWGRYVIALIPWLAGLIVLSFFDVIVALEPVLPESVTQAPLTTVLLSWARPTVAALVPLTAAFGLNSLTQRLLAVAAAFLAVSVLVQVMGLSALA